MRAILGIGALVALALVTGAAGAAGGTDVLDLLQPGTRPRVGLGGDPFLSPFDDGYGFWGDVHFTTAGSNRLDARYSAPFLLDAGRGGARVERSELAWTAAGGWSNAGRAIHLAARVVGVDWTSSWAGSPGPVHLGGRGAQLILGTRLTDPLPGLTVQGYAPVVNAQGGRTADGGLGLRYRRGSHFAVQGAWSRTSAAEQLGSALYDEPVAASLNLRANRYAMDGRWRPWGRFEAEYSTSWNFYGVIEPRDTTLVYNLSPGGRTATQQAGLVWGGAGRSRVLVRWSQTLVNLDGMMSWGGVRFAQLPYLSGNLSSWLTGFEHGDAARGRWLVEAEVVNLSAHGRGEVESWPFTSVLTNLLGVRMIGRANAEARWTRLHAALQRPVRSGLRLEGGLTWYDARPRATLVTWRPAFLVFGQEDLQEHALEVHRVQAGAVSLGMLAQFGGLIGQIQLRQFVMAKMFRTGGVSPASPAPAGETVTTGHSRHWPGGTQVEFALTRSF